MRALPLGTSTFETLRESNEIYVDKTELVYKLAATGRGKIFLARPRRFGKSLLVSTFESLFAYGLRDFRGLAIEKWWIDKTYPVVRLDFSKLKAQASTEAFEKAFCDYLQESFFRLGFCYDATRTSFFSQFDAWMQSLSVNFFVLLIDEYDAPLTERLNDPKAFREIRDLFARFFSIIKSNEGCLRFFFMTGVTKFSSTSIFSAFNNLQDISLDSLYSTLLGYTQQEIENYFFDYLKEAAAALQVPCEEVLKELKNNYNGFCFDQKAKTRVYCPWSVLNFFNRPDQGFANYWYMSSGQPTALVKFLEGHALSDPANYGDEIEVPLSDLAASNEYDTISLSVLLFQTGYLTIKAAADDGWMHLGYPNQEVAVAMAQLYSRELLKGKRLRKPDSPGVGEVLATADDEQVVEYFNWIFNAIDYQAYPVTGEMQCRALLQVLLIGAGIDVVVEKHTALGGSDLEVETGNRRWIFEFKFAKDEEEVGALLEQAVEQVRSRRYSESASAKELNRMALVFDAAQRRFVAWQRV
jgi:hypothetical protein